MRRMLFWSFAAACLLQATNATAQMCDHYIPGFADGRVTGPITAGVGNVAAMYFFGAPGHSYSVEVVSADDGTISSATGSANQACPTTNAAGVTSNLSMVPSGDGRSTRVSFTASSTGYIITRVPSGTFTFSVSDTTLYNSSWSTASGFATQWGLQNTTGSTITGVLTVTEAFGGSATYTRSVSLAPNVTTFVYTSDAFVGGPIPANRGGSATFSHNAPSGAVNGDGYLLNGLTIVPISFRAVRESGR